MSPKEASKFIGRLFSEEGVEIKGFKITAESPFVANVEHEDGMTVITFGINQPKASITKIITVYAYIEQVVLGLSGGSIKLRNFPDISFSYEGNTFFKLDSEPVDFTSIEKDIECRFSSEDQKIARLALQYANEWATICRDSGITFSKSDCIDRYVMHKDCYSFVKEKVEKELESQHGSFVITWLFAYVILPIIVRWIVNKVLDRLYSNL